MLFFKYLYYLIALYISFSLISYFGVLKIHFFYYLKPVLKVETASTRLLHDII